MQRPELVVKLDRANAVTRVEPNNTDIFGEQNYITVKKKIREEVKKKYYPFSVTVQIILGKLSFNFFVLFI